MTPADRQTLAEDFAKTVLRAYNKDLNVNRPPIDEPRPINAARVDDALRAAIEWMGRPGLEKTNG